MILQGICQHVGSLIINFCCTKIPEAFDDLLPKPSANIVTPGERHIKTSCLPVRDQRTSQKFYGRQSSRPLVYDWRYPAGYVGLGVRGGQVGDGVRGRGARGVHGSPPVRGSGRNPRLGGQPSIQRPGPRADNLEAINLPQPLRAFLDQRNILLYVQISKSLQ